MILTLNNFVFNGCNYHQIKGTAMGTRAAPNYANIFMGQFEEANIYQTDWMRYINSYGRFIDDIFLIWRGTEQQLKEFITHLNNVHTSIKFTSEYSKTAINFLDVTVLKDAKGYLSTDVYQKATDTHNYLNRNSAHPNHCMTSIPYSQFLRLKRIVSNPDTLKRRMKEYIEYFVNSGYSRAKLEQTVRKILTDERPSPRLPKTSDENRNTVRFITTYNKAMPNINNIVQKHWNIVHTNERCRNALKSEPQTVYKRSQNLSDILVRAKFRKGEAKNPFNVPKNVTRCGKCSWCKHITEGPTFKSYTTGREYKIYHEMNCTSPWVVYLCSCKIHKIQYVGKSTTKLNIRMNNNRNHLRVQDRSCKLVQHFLDSKTCSFVNDLVIMPIEQIKMNNSTSSKDKQAVLSRREIFWQNMLGTLTPGGMNKREG